MAYYTSAYEYKRFFKIIRHPNADQLEIPKNVYKRYFSSSVPNHDISIHLGNYVVFNVSFRGTRHKMYITNGWRAIRNALRFEKRGCLLFSILDEENWGLTVFLADGSLQDLSHIPVNNIYPHLDWMDDESVKTNSDAQRKYSVSNAFNGTKLFFNSDKVKEIVSFREKFLETSEEESTSSFSSISNSIEYNMEKDFLISTDYSHSAEVDSVTKKKDLIVLGTIVFIQPKWFYPACNHYNRIVQRTDEGDEASYCCSNPVCIKEKRVINLYPRFKILFKVQDSAGTVDMTMFDSVANQIIKKTASDFVVLLTFKTSAIIEPLPNELQDLIDRKFAFKISVTEFNIDNRYKYYTVIRVTDDPIFISSLEKKHNHDEVSNPQGSNTSQKDCLGISPSEVTPDSVNMVVRVIDCESNGLKCNLSDVYDADHLSITSFTKTRSTESGKCSVSGSDDEDTLVWFSGVFSSQDTLSFSK
ncbi:hypothetical protein SSX86_024553 [Deinandra increscens subsp. villosa]|uniref:Replication factor A C-terminal domain-containing protein n=1 Tax=Deinandra increscens subsp. villosa TaxID=3103831 RepID=A0AAP0CJI6_9ASTR